MIRTKFFLLKRVTVPTVGNESLRLQFLMKEIYIDILKKFV